MKKTKKIVIITIIILPLAIVLSIFLNNKLTFSKFEKNSTLEYELLHQFTKDELLEFHAAGGFGMNTIYSIDFPEPFGEEEFDYTSYSNEFPMTYYELSGYPTILSEYHLTGLTTTDPAVSILSIAVGDVLSKEEVEEAVGDFNYKLEKLSESGSFKSFQFQKAKIKLTVYTDKGIVTKIVVRVKSIHIPGVVF